MVFLCVCGCCQQSPRLYQSARPGICPPNVGQKGSSLPWGQGYTLSIRALGEARAGESEARRLNRTLEDLIRECPGQYLWGYNRYKPPAGASDPE